MPPHLKCALGLSVLAAAACSAPGSLPAYVDEIPRNHPMISYDSSQPEDAIAELGKASNFEWNSEATAPIQRLAQLLNLLDLNRDSQTLVFSKTSFQSTFISPRNPRALYFNDRLVVAHVRGSPILEATALDRKGGNRFYTLDLGASRGSFQRQDSCLRCHQGVATQGVPGAFVGSVFPSSNGAAAGEGAIITDHRTRFEDRWGGWYVNARAGEPSDRANAVAPNPVAQTVLYQGGDRQNRFCLLGQPGTQGYLSCVSDIVALMTLEHQTQAANLISRLSWLARIAEGTRPPDPETRRKVSAAVDDLLRYLLFVDEQPLPAPVQGVSTFVETFPKRGPHDRHGRSLRDFDLKTRLFRYPLSYMIYSASFDAIPKFARTAVYSRLRGVLSGSNETRVFGTLTPATRGELASILRETKPEALLERCAP